MTLSEKIYTCRKKSGRSQEALAEILGVSRQSVSKWETGDAEPEIGKLRLLAETFGVSVDWLLSEDDAPDAAETVRSEPPEPNAAVEVLDAIPGFLGKMVKRFGWIYGVYIAVSGAMFTLIGGLARSVSNAMFSDFNDFGVGFGAPDISAGITLYDTAGNLITDQALINEAARAMGLAPQSSGVTMTNPVATVGGLIMGFGVIVMIAGVALALWLRKKSGPS